MGGSGWLLARRTKAGGREVSQFSQPRSLAAFAGRVAPEIGDDDGGRTEQVSLSDPEFRAEELCGISFETFGRELDRELAMEIIRKAAARSSRHSKYHEAHLRGQMTQAEAARELGIKENSFKVAHHRFRERLARDIWAEVSNLAGEDETAVRDEIAYLMSLFAEGGR